MIASTPTSLLARHKLPHWLAGISCALLASGAAAASFEIAATPSLFELSGKGGARIGQSITIYNVGNAPTDLTMRTLDWTFSPEGEVSYHDALLDGSCRPWVTLERHQVRVNPRGNTLFRFQVQIPADAPRGECRFMVALEGTEPAQMAVIKSKGASMRLPVSGRIAIPVYLATNGAQPKLEAQATSLRTVQGRQMVALTVHNSGDAHGRIHGSLEAVDAQGTKHELFPEGGPILPGQTRTLLLNPQPQAGKPAPALTLPVRLKGTLEWELGGFKIDTVLQ